MAVNNTAAWRGGEAAACPVMNAAMMMSRDSVTEQAQAAVAAVAVAAAAAFVWMVWAAAASCLQETCGGFAPTPFFLPPHTQIAA